MLTLYTYGYMHKGKMNSFFVEEKERKPDPMF